MQIILFANGGCCAAPNPPAFVMASHAFSGHLSAISTCFLIIQYHVSLYLPPSQKKRLPPRRQEFPPSQTKNRLPFQKSAFHHGVFWVG